MIKHIVLWKIKENAEGKSKAENIQMVKEMLLSLKNLPMLIELEVGINAENADKSNFDISLLTVFNSIDNLNAYQVHPDHKAVAAYIGKVREERACIDYTF